MQNNFYLSAMQEASFGNRWYKEDLELAKTIEGVSDVEFELVEQVYLTNREYGLRRDMNNFAQHARNFAEKGFDLRNIRSCLRRADFESSQLGIISSVRIK